MQASLISPNKITGAVAVSNAKTTHPVGLYGRRGEAGKRKVCILLGIIERGEERRN